MNPVPELIEAQILIVDNDSSSTQLLRDGLQDFNNVHIFHSGEEALSFCRGQTPDLILLDVDMPGLDGLEVCREIREMSMLTRCPIIFLCDDHDHAKEIESWEAGGSDFLRKPVVAAALKMRVMSHLTSHWHIEITNRLHHTDSLTGLYNRYFFDKHIKEQLAYAHRYRSDMSLMIVDLNCFKKFNDQYGHACGDKALRKIANALRKTVGRAPDSVCRFGGEEFTILLPGTDFQGARVVAERIGANLSELAIPFEGQCSGCLSASIGISSLSHAKEQALTLFEAADKDLRLSKLAHASQVA